MTYVLANPFETIFVEALDFKIVLSNKEFGVHYSWISVALIKILNSILPFYVLIER